MKKLTFRLICALLCVFSFTTVAEAGLKLGDQFSLCRKGRVSTTIGYTLCTDKDMGGNATDLTGKGTYMNDKGLPSTYSNYFCRGSQNVVEMTTYYTSGPGGVKEFTGLCIDPVLDGPSSRGCLTYTVNRIMFDESADESTLRYDRALYTIYNEGYVKTGAVSCDASGKCTSNISARQLGIVQTAARFVHFYFGQDRGTTNVKSGYLLNPESCRNSSGNIPGCIDNLYNNYEVYKITTANMAKSLNHEVPSNLRSFLLTPSININTSAASREWWGLYNGFLPIEQRGLFYGMGGPNQASNAADFHEVIKLFDKALKNSKDTSINSSKRLKSSDFELTQENASGITQVSGNTYKRTVTVQISNTSTLIDASKHGYFRNIVFDFAEESASLRDKLNITAVSADNANYILNGAGSQNFAYIKDPTFTVTITGTKEALASASEIYIEAKAEFFDWSDANNFAQGWVASRDITNQRILLFRDEITSDLAEKYKEKIKINFNCDEMKDEMDEICKNDPDSDECKEKQDEYYDLCGTCDDLENKRDNVCEANPDSKECKELEKEYIKECGSCKEVKPFYDKCKDGTNKDKDYCKVVEDWYEENCDEDDKCLTVSLGYGDENQCDKDKPTSTIKISETKDEDMKACIVGTDNSTPSKDGTKGEEKTDDAGNTRTVKGLKNAYCNVSCKEDYIFNLPSNLGSYKAGTFFGFNASIEGTRTCVTSDINRPQFDKDLKEALNDVADKYTKYMEAKEFAEASVEMVFGGRCTYPCGTKERPRTCSCGEYENAKKEYTYPIMIFNERTWTMSTKESSTQTKIESGSCGGGCSPRDGSFDQSALNRARDLAKIALEEAEKNVKDIISSMQSCSSWVDATSNGGVYQYVFDPEIVFEYEESYYMSMLDGTGLKTTVETAAAPVNELCTRQTDNSYVCASPYSNLSSVPTTPYNYYVCANSDCTSLTLQTAQIKNTVNIKNTSKRKANYEPSTYFMKQHPSGAIVKTTEANNASAVYSDLGYVFPIRLTTPAGEYNYVLRFNNVGQFYDNLENLGRIYSIDANVNSTIKKQDQVSFHDGTSHLADYYCQYNVLGDVTDMCISVGIGQADGAITYGYRPISLNDVFPNAATRESGSNWATPKGVATQEQIEDLGDRAYLNAQYSYTMNATQMANTRAHNRQKENEGTGYDDFDLICDKGIDCTSQFLNDDSEMYFTEHARNTHFESWKRQDGLGPSWY